MKIWDWNRVIGFDMETSGKMKEFALQPWRIPAGDAWPTSISVVQVLGQPRKPHVMPTMSGLFPDKAKCQAFLEHARDAKLRIVGWNTVFDIMVLIGMGLKELVFQCQWLDGMLIWKHATVEPEYGITTSGKRKLYGLKACVAELYPQYANYAEDVDFHSTDPAELQKLQTYNDRDVAFTLGCTKHWWDQLNDRQRRVAIIEAASLPHVALANYTGMLIDPLTIHELQAGLDRVAYDKLTLLLPLGVTEATVRSPVKLAAMLFDTWGLTPIKFNVSKITGKKTRSTDKETLYEIAHSDPRAKTLRDYREALNLKTKFADAPLASAEYHGDGYARPAAIIFGTYSGRMTYAANQTVERPNKAGTGMKQAKAPVGFALHQMKNGPQFRTAVLAPPGYDIVEFDAAGQEFRWMAEASGDETMRALCLPGEDPHSFMGARIAHRDYKGLILDLKHKDILLSKLANDQRKLGKVGNLSLQYRTSAPKLRSVARVQYNIPMELPEAERIRNTYLHSYENVPIYWDQQIAKTKRLGYVETLAGRRVKVVGDWSGNWGWSMGSTAINYRIQGTGADQKYLAMACLEETMRQHDAVFAWDLHDGLYFYVPCGKSMAFAEAGKKVLDALPYARAWGMTPSIPMPWDCKKGGSWGTLKEVSF